MGEPPPIRVWARDNGWPTLGSRGPIGFDIRQGYASSYGLPEPERTERPAGNSERPPRQERARTWAKCTGANGCGREWKGHDEAHCMRCHRHFSTVKNFDSHLAYVRGTDEEETKCVEPLTLKTGKGELRFTTKQSFGGETIIQLVTRKMPQAKTWESEQLELVQ